MASWKKILTALPAMTDLASSGHSTSKFLKGDGTWDTPSSGSDTTYSISCVDGDNSDEEKIRLTAGGSGSGTDDVVLEAGTGLSIARSSDKITFTNTVSDTNTTYTAGTGMSLSGTEFSCTVTDTNTTYSAGTGLTLSSTTFSISSGAALSNLGGGSGSTFLKKDGTWATPTDTNTTYSAGTGMSLSGTEFSCTVTNTDVNTNVTNLVARLPQISENVTIGDGTDVAVTMAGDLTVTGDLLVSGDTVTVNVGSLLVEDKVITVAKGSGSAANATTAGIEVDTGNATQKPSIVWGDVSGLRQWSLTYEGDTTGLPIAINQIESTSGTPAGLDTIAGSLCYNSADGDLYFYDAT